MQLVGFTGKAGSGKDTLADYLVENHHFLKLSFAGPLKAMMAQAGMPEPKERAAKEQPLPGFAFTWREAAQKLGTEWGRSLDPDIWVKIMESVIHRFSDDVQIVFADVRFDNEAEMIRRLGGKILHITGRSADLGANAGHASEAGVTWIDGDYSITNDRFVEDAQALVRHALWGGK
jgi:hypothetical protein